MAEKLGDLYVEIGAKTDKLQGSLNDAERMSKSTADKMAQGFRRASDVFNADGTKKEIKSLETATAQSTSKMTGMFEKLTGSVGRVAGAIGLAVGSTYLFKKGMDFLGKSLEAYEQRVSLLDSVRASIHSMGKESEFTSSAILKMADRLAAFNNYRFKPDEILDLTTLLVSFDNVTNENLPRLTQAVLDTAAKMKTGLKEAAISIGIAFDSPAEGMTRLRRSGIAFTEEEKKIVQSLTDAGKQAEAQTFILDKLEKKVGGFAATTITTLDASLNKWKEFKENLERSVGSIVARAVEPLAKAFTDMIPEDSFDQWEKLDARIKKVDKDVPSLVSKYDELTAKAKAGKDVHQELDDTIQQLASLFPGAITGWDQYGRAIGLSTRLIWDQIDAEKARLKFLNQSAIEQLKIQRQLIAGEMIMYEMSIKRKGTISVAGGGQFGGGVEVINKATDEEVAAWQRRIAELGELAKGMDEQLKVLSGENLGKEGKGGTPAVPKASDETLKARLAALREQMAAEMKLSQAKINDDFERDKKALSDRRVLSLKKIADEVKDEQTASALKKAVQAEYEADTITLNRNHEEKLFKDRMAFEDKYRTESQTYARQLIDQRVRNYAISTAEFKAYIDAQLEYEIQQLQSQNKKIEEYNKEHGTKFATFDIEAYRKAGQIENAGQTGQYDEGKKQKQMADWRKNNKEISQVVEGTIGDVSGAWQGTLDEMLRGQINFGEGIKGMWQGLTSSILSQLEQIAAKAAALFVIKTIAGAFGINIPTASMGGDFIGTSGGVKRMASGGSFLVPDGFNNDSYPLMVSSGERVNVTPAGQTAVQQADWGEVLKRLEAMNANIANQRHQISGAVRVDVRGKTDGQDIYVVNKKAGRVYSRIR